jgi:nucleolar protein 56
MGKIDQLRKKLIESAKKKIQEKYKEKEVHIIKAVKILEDLDTTSNLLIEQLREWHSVHFPELNEIVKDNEQYLKLVFELGDKRNFVPEKIFDVVPNKVLAEKISQAAKKSIGSEASQKDINEMQSLALNCHNLKAEREAMAKYIETEMKKELPAFTELCGAILGAKILAKALSKKRLAFMPASRLQVIGAEKSLFMHFKMKAKSPKYGYIFQHPLIQGSKPYNRGKVARLLAAKLSIAAKMDYFGSKADVQDIKRELEEKARKINETGKGAKIQAKKTGFKWRSRKRKRFEYSNK